MSSSHSGSNSESSSIDDKLSAQEGEPGNAHEAEATTQVVCGLRDLL